LVLPGVLDCTRLHGVEQRLNHEALAECPYEGNLPHDDAQQTLAINRLDGGLFVTARLASDFSFATAVGIAASSPGDFNCRSPMIVRPSSPIQFSTALSSAPEIQCI
jgi:hypothetical protein